MAHWFVKIQLKLPSFRQGCWHTNGEDVQRMKDHACVYLVTTALATSQLWI
jgi:hypothetical protein